MSASEIEAALRRYRARLEVILAPEDLAAYEAYQQRVQAGMARDGAVPVQPSLAEQAILDKIEADTEARALNRQFFALIRVEHLPQ